MLQPRRYGGYALDYGVNCEISTEIARGCPSSGWISSITTCHHWILGMMEKEAQEHVWGDDDGPAGGKLPVFPRSRGAERVTGGYKLGGRWRFQRRRSLPVGAGAGGAPGESRRRPHVRPAAAQGLQDRGRVARDRPGGHRLERRGRGKDLFVPDSHMLRTNDPERRPDAGQRGENPEHIYALPLWGAFAYNLVGPAWARRSALSRQLAEQIKARPATRFGAQLSKLQSVRLRLAKAPPRPTRPARSWRATWRR